MAIISYKNKFIFIKGRKIAGTSMELALLKFCGRNDVVGKLNDEHYNEWIGLKSAKKYISSAQSKKINVKGFYTFIASFVKVLPLTKSIFKFNYSPNFSLKIPLFVEKNLDPHSTIGEVKKIAGDDFFNKAIKFTIVRNPYDQFLSYYMSKTYLKKFDKEKFHNFAKNHSYYFFNREYTIISLNNTLPYDKIIKYENLKKDIEELGNMINLPENLYDIFKNILANKLSGTKPNIIEKDTKKIIYTNAYNFFKLFNYSEN
jgi:hypothetical protein|tara:strand:+ start:335 stop:1111 length:777 start_codon:yes stop_codon:yes gene_type:complete